MLKYDVKLEKPGLICMFDVDNKEYILKCWEKKKDIILEKPDGTVISYKTKNFDFLEIKKNDR